MWAHASGLKRQQIGCRVPPFSGSTSTISRFGECFRDGQFSLVSLVFAVLLLTVLPPPRPFVKVAARAPVSSGVDALVLERCRQFTTRYKKCNRVVAAVAGYLAMIDHTS